MQKTLYLLLLGGITVLGSLPALAQNGNPDKVQIDSWGTHSFTLGNFAGSKKVGFLAGMTRGTDGTEVRPGKLESKIGGKRIFEEVKPIRSYLPHLFWQLTVESGKMHDVKIDYDPAPDTRRILWIRMRGKKRHFP